MEVVEAGLAGLRLIESVIVRGQKGRCWGREKASSSQELKKALALRLATEQARLQIHCSRLVLALLYPCESGLGFSSDSSLPLLPP